MKKIFIYYSLTGNGDLIAKTLKEKKVEIRKVKTKYKYPQSQLLRIIIGGYKATFKKQDKLVNFDKNIEEFDEIIIGSPIWNDRLCAPINAVLSKINLKGKKVTFILYSGTGKTKKALEQIKKYCDAKIINLKDPIIYKQELKKLNEKEEKQEEIKKIEKKPETKSTEIKKTEKKEETTKEQKKKEETKKIIKKTEQKKENKTTKKTEDKK